MQKKVFLLSGVVSLLFIFTCSVKIHAQTNCNCNAADRQEFDRLNEDNDSSGVYQLLNKLKQSPNKNCAVFACSMEVEYLLRRLKREQALLIIEEQKKLVELLPCKDELIIENWLDWARYYKGKEQYENLSAYAFKALEHAENRKNKLNELKALTFIVYLFTRQNEGAKNWAYIKKAEKIIISLEENYKTPSHYNWLALEYENKYTETERATLLDSAILYATKAKAAALQYKDYLEVTQAFRVFEAYSYHKGNMKNSAAFMDSALFYAKKVKTPTNLASLYLTKADGLAEMQQNSEAMRWLDTCIFYTEKYQHGAPASIGIYLEASRIYNTVGNLPASYSAFKKYDQLKDSLYKIQRAEKINELEQKYNMVKNEKTIKELDQQKSIYLLLALAGLLALVGVAFFVRHQALKSKQKIMETEQRLNRARMNPHFFFNALASLQSFALQENDGKALASNLSKFSHIMRETLESTYKEYVTLEQEKDFLQEYLELQRMRFPQKFSYTITIDETIDSDQVVIPSMILQPFVENCIEHGFTGIDYPGDITVTFLREAKDLHIAITDNGKGLAVYDKENNEHISRASQIIRDRIYLLNVKLKTRASFSIDNAANDKGVTVAIKLPLLFKQDVRG
jgi:two-component sensor histidine kinase